MSLDLEEVFNRLLKGNDYLKFDRVENKLSQRPDLHAFMLLDRLVPGPGRDIISAAEHDQYWIDIDPDKLAAAATEEDILTLIRCGISYNAHNASLMSFT
jgi:hypothetical protein